MKTLLRVLAVLLLPAAALPAAAADMTTQDGPRIAVPAHDIERGETIAASDLVVQTIAPDRVRAGVVTAVPQIVGREARRLLHAGEPIGAEDIRMPILVEKGAMVTMTFDVPGISLVATGRAMSEGGLGEVVVVQNPISFRQVSCVVTGPGQVRAGDATPVSVADATTNP